MEAYGHYSGCQLREDYLLRSPLPLPKNGGGTVCYFLRRTRTRLVGLKSETPDRSTCLPTTAVLSFHRPRRRDGPNDTFWDGEGQGIPP